mmetsp:Transcript_11164/g.34616  ORF Transcript_11164/g.34616 Transcript_11164/m.34616 type:complete len:287 (-) Transcript_11164:306-1166(-)
MRELRGRNHGPSRRSLLAAELQGAVAGEGRVREASGRRAAHRFQGRCVADGQQAGRQSAGALSRGVSRTLQPQPHRSDPLCVLVLDRGNERVEEDLVRRPAIAGGDPVQLVQDRRAQRRAAVAEPALVPTRAQGVEELARLHRAEAPTPRGVDGDRDGVLELPHELLAVVVHRLSRHGQGQPRPRRWGRRVEEVLEGLLRARVGARLRRRLVRRHRGEGRPAHVNARRFQDSCAVGRSQRSWKQLPALGPQTAPEGSRRKPAPAPARGLRKGVQLLRLGAGVSKKR